MLSRAGLSYQDWGIEIFWQPSSDDVGRQPYCFSAIDSEGFVSSSFSDRFVTIYIVSDCILTSS